LGLVRPSSVGLVGHSRGGGVALLFARRNARISALATWAAVGHLNRWSEAEADAWRRNGYTSVENSRTGQILKLYPDLLDDVERHTDAFNLEAAAAELTIPWLLAHGTADETVPVSEGQRLADAAGGRARTLWLEGALHGFGGVHPFGGMTPHLRTLFDATVAHMGTHLA
jgi:pimeloyl-ACP methyl ester carboxylesterase